MEPIVSKTCTTAFLNRNKLQHDESHAKRIVDFSGVNINDAQENLNWLLNTCKTIKYAIECVLAARDESS